MGHTAAAYERDRSTLEPLLTIGETARCLAVTPRTIYRLVQAGDLRPTRVGARRRFEAAEIRRYLEENREHGVFLENRGDAE